jgi:prepilin-type N-terminal cleavage/methylation domain-containing protein
MKLAKARRRSRAASAGFSLVEVMVAMLIGAVMVTAVLGVSVSATQGSTRSAHRQALNQGIAQVTAELKNYVTACGCQKSGGACPAPGCTLIAGPNANNGANRWSLNAAPGMNGNITDSMGNVWALACGTHNLTGIVPGLETATYGAGTSRISYNVTWPIGGCFATVPTSIDVPAITFSANWTEP